MFRGEMKNDEKESVSIKISGDAVKDLDKMKEITGDRDYEEVIKNALAIYTYLITHTQNGGKICFIDTKRIINKDNKELRINRIKSRL